MAKVIEGMMKSTDGKIPYELIPPEAMEEYTKAMQYGADKYEPNDWRRGSGMRWTMIIAAILRHTFALLRGEDIDKTSGLHHGAHIMCGASMLIFYSTYSEIYNQDDRFLVSLKRRAR